MRRLLAKSTVIGRISEGMTMRYILLFALAFMACDAQAKKYIYANHGVIDEYLAGRDTLVLDTGANEVVSGDAIDEVHFCGKKDEFHCFHNAALNFYVVKRPIRLHDTWMGAEGKFEVVRQETLALLGQRRSVWVIRAVRQDRVDLFYYSESRGLLGFKHAAKSSQTADGVPVYFVEGGEGFPR